MARIERHKKSTRGKDLKCSKCGKEIAVGEEYLKATPYHRTPIIRCVKCGLKSYETSGSQYVQDIGSIVEDWQESFGTSDGVTDEIISSLEEIRDYTQESLDNMPEQLQEGDTGCMLQDRIDCIEGAISDLEQISYEDLKEDLKEEAESNIGEYDPDTWDDEDQWKEEVAEELDHLVEDAYIEAIDDALSQLEY